VRPQAAEPMDKPAIKGATNSILFTLCTSRRSIRTHTASFLKKITVTVHSIPSGLR
jgi:hypothetical protein